LGISRSGVFATQVAAVAAPMGLYGNFLLDSGVVHVSDAGGWDVIPTKEI